MSAIFRFLYLGCVSIWLGATVVIFLGQTALQKKPSHQARTCLKSITSLYYSISYVAGGSIVMIWLIGRFQSALFTGASGLIYLALPVLMFALELYAGFMLNEQLDKISDTIESSPFSFDNHPTRPKYIRLERLLNHVYTGIMAMGVVLIFLLSQRMSM